MNFSLNGVGEIERWSRFYFVASNGLNNVTLFCNLNDVTTYTPLYL
jgi:hypothetical protein